jgi:hypothetical protein
MWTDYDHVRRYLALTDEEVPDSDLEMFIEDAQRNMLRDIASKVTDEEPSGSINGSNTTFELDHKYIADMNFNSSVDASDVQVYGWTDEDDPSTKSSLSVSTIYPAYAKIVLTTAPPSTYEKITVDYYYHSGPVNLEEFSDACACLAAYGYALSEISMMPDQWMHGAYRFTKGNSYKELYDLYIHKIDRINARMSDRAEHDTMTLLRS